MSSKCPKYRDGWGWEVRARAKYLTQAKVSLIQRYPHFRGAGMRFHCIIIILEWWLKLAITTTNTATSTDKKNLMLDLQVQSQQWSRNLQTCVGGWSDFPDYLHQESNSASTRETFFKIITLEHSYQNSTTLWYPGNVITIEVVVTLEKQNMHIITAHLGT